MAQYAYPSSDNAVQNWYESTGDSQTNIYVDIGESTRDDSDYIYSTPDGSPDSNPCEIGLGSLSDPGVHTGHVVRYTYLRSKTNKNLTLVVRLIDSSYGTVASWTHVNPSDAFTLAQQTLTETQAGYITSYSDLALQFEVTVNAAGGGHAEVSWAELEVPDAGTDTDDSQIAYLRGGENVNDSQLSFLHGSVGTQDNTSAYTDGKQTGQDSQSSYLDGKDSGSDSQTAYLDGYLSDSPAVTRILFHVPAGEITPASDSTSAFAHGEDTTLDSQSAYIHGKDESDSSQDAFTDGQSLETDSQSAYLAGIDTDLDSTSAYLAGKDTDTDSQSAYLLGGLGANDNQNAYLEGTMPGAWDSISAFLQGIQRTSVNAFTIGSLSAKPISWTLKNDSQFPVYYPTTLYCPEAQDAYWYWIIKRVAMSDTGQYVLLDAHRRIESPYCPGYMYQDFTYRSTNYGQSWTQVANTLSNGGSRMSVSRTGQYAVISNKTHTPETYASTIKVSSDYLASMSTVLNWEYALDIVISPDGGVIYFHDSNNVVKKSTNMGSSWDTVTPSNYEYSTAFFRITTNEDGSKVLISTYDSSYHGLAYVSSNGGSSWTKIDSYTEFGELYYRHFMAPNGTIYFGTNSYDVIYKSTDLLSSYSLVTSSFSMSSLTQLALSDSGTEVVIPGLYSKSWDEFVSFWDISSTGSSPDLEDIWMSRSGKHYIGVKYIPYYIEEEDLYVDEPEIWYGTEDVLSSVHACIPGINTSSKSAYTQGIDSAQDSQSAYTYSGAKVTDSTPAYLEGYGLEADSSLSAYLAGKNTDINSQPAYLYGDADIYDNQSAYTEGAPIFASSSTLAFILGCITDTSPAYLEGSVLVQDSTPAYVCTMTDDVSSTKSAYVTGTMRESLPAYLTGIIVQKKYVTITAGGLSKNFLILQQGYDNGTEERAETIHKTISGGLNISVGSLSTTWSLVVRVKAEDTVYGDKDDLEYLFSLNEPITFVDHYGIDHQVVISGNMRKNLVTIAVEGEDAIYFYRLNFISSV